MPTDVLDARPFNPNTDTDLQARIRAEFSEMPGLKITLAQACRLFNAQRSQCERVLAGLMRNDELSSRGDLFLRANCEHTSKHNLAA